MPAEIVWPAYEPELFTDEPADPELRRRLGIAEDEAVLVYAGNVHDANAAEMRSLYLAVAALNRSGRRVRLVRLGRDFVRFVEPELRELHDYVVHLPLQPRSEVPRYMRLADVLVQPGRADAFNDYRFPSKLPEFFACGRPVVLPETNLGRYVADGEDCLLLRRGDALEIAAAVERILADDELRERLGRGARDVRRADLQLAGERGEAARALRASARGRAASALPRRSGAPRRHGSSRPPRLCDRARLLRLGRAPARARSFRRPEGRPAPLGAEGGRGHGSARRAPARGRRGRADRREHALRARIRRDRDRPLRRPRSRPDRARLPALGPPGASGSCAASIPTEIPDEERFDCVYSISVLEHLPAAAIERTCAALLEHTDAGGFTIHAVDHVLLGPGDADHRAAARPGRGRARDRRAASSTSCSSAWRTIRRPTSSRPRATTAGGARRPTTVPDAALRLDPALHPGARMSEASGIDVGIVAYR